MSSLEYELTGLKKDGEVDPSGPIYLEIGRFSDSLVGTEIEPGRSKRFRSRLELKTETDIEQLIKHDYAVIEYVLVVEDEKGPYEVCGTVEAEIPGPDAAIRGWERHLEETDQH